MLNATRNGSYEGAGLDPACPKSLGLCVIINSGRIKPSHTATLRLVLPGIRTDYRCCVFPRYDKRCGDSSIEQSPINLQVTCYFLPLGSHVSGVNNEGDRWQIKAPFHWTRTACTVSSAQFSPVQRCWTPGRSSARGSGLKSCLRKHRGNELPRSKQSSERHYWSSQ